MKGVQCYELFGGIALKNHAFSLLNLCIANKDMYFFFFIPKWSILSLSVEPAAQTNLQNADRK